MSRGTILEVFVAVEAHHATRGFVVANARAQFGVLAERAKKHTALGAFRPDSCLFRSEPTEPVFVLCARDPEAIECIEMWVALRLDKLKKARELLGIDGATPGTVAYAQLERMHAKLGDARDAVQAFETWQAGAKRRAQGG